MYGEFAEPFDLYECQLAIIHCGSHDDTALIESLWQNIIDKGEWLCEICHHFTGIFLSNYDTYTRWLECLCANSKFIK